MRKLFCIQTRIWETANDTINHCLSIKHSTSPLFPGVAESDAGTYSCNLHHHYCHLYETVKIQLVIAKRGGCGGSSRFYRCHRRLGKHQQSVVLPVLFAVCLPEFQRVYSGWLFTNLSSSLAKHCLEPAQLDLCCW